MGRDTDYRYVCLLIIRQGFCIIYHEYYHFIRHETIITGNMCASKPGIINSFTNQKYRIRLILEDVDAARVKRYSLFTIPSSTSLRIN